MKHVRVVLVDDHQMLAEALALRLSAVPELSVVGMCTTDERQVIDVVRRTQPDVVCVDVATVAAKAGRLTGDLLAAAPSSRIVVLTASHDPQLAAEVARKGAQAWVSKESTVDDVVEVLLAVCEGRASYPDYVLGAVLRELRASADHGPVVSGPVASLSSRERDVLVAMVQGKSAIQIAPELRLSVNTVRTHTRNILSKLHVHNRLEAIKVAFDAGIEPGGTVASDESAGRVVPFRKE